MRIICCVICFLCCLYPLNAQEKEESEAELDAIIDELILDENSIIEYLEELEKYQVLFVALDFNNKTYFLGRDLGLDQYTLSPQLVYQHHSGVYVGVSGAIYSEFDPKWDISTASVGFSKNFGTYDNFNFDIGYSRYIFSDDLSRDFENSLDASFSIETKNRLLGGAATVTYFFGEEQGVQNSFDIYSSIDLFKLSKKHQVSLNPQVSFIVGNESIDTSRFNDILTDIPLVGRIVNEFETYALRNTQLAIPLNVELGDFEVEFGYNFNFPNALLFERNLENTSFFNLGLSYILSFK